MTISKLAARIMITNSQDMFDVPLRYVPKLIESQLTESEVTSNISL